MVNQSIIPPLSLPLSLSFTIQCTKQDLRKETILSSKKPAQQQTTPKRPMSPLKRFNKVAPIPTTPTKPKGSQLLPNTKERLDSRLQSSSASILDDQVRREEEEAMSVSTSDKKRPGSAPTTEGFRRGTLDTTTKVVVQSQTKDTVERESQNQTGEFMGFDILKLDTT